MAECLICGIFMDKDTVFCDDPNCKKEVKRLILFSQEEEKMLKNDLGGLNQKVHNLLFENRKLKSKIKALEKTLQAELK
jgi:hypothetical protein